MPQKAWAVGEEVLAADFNSYVQNQTVPQFATNAARDAGWAAPPNGALCATTDTNTTWRRVAGVWVRLNEWQNRSAQPPLIGAAHLGPVLLWTSHLVLTTDAAGDALVIDAGSIAGVGGSVLSAHLAGSQVYGLVGAFRNAGGNLYVKIFNGTTLAVSTGVDCHITVLLA